MRQDCGRGILFKGRPGESRAILTAVQAVQIYMLKKSDFPETSYLSGNANAVAAKYHVSHKTVRDIWNRRTWTEETNHLWKAGEGPIIRSRRRQDKYGGRHSQWSCTDSPNGVVASRSRESPSSSCHSPSADEEQGAEATQQPCRTSTDSVVTMSCDNWQWECGQPPLLFSQDDPFALDL